MLRDYSRQHPNTHLILEEAEEPALLRGLETGQYDAVIGRRSMFSDETCQIHTLAADELVVVLPAGHPLACKDHLSIPELASERLLLMNQYTAVCQICLQCFADAGVTPRLIRTTRVESLISAIAAGERISLLPESNRNVFHCEGLITVSLTPSVALPVVLAYRKNKKGLTNASLRELVQHIQGIQTQTA